MSRVPSLRDILDDIQDDVSDSDEGEFETIEVQKPIQKRPLLDIPDEYRVLNKPQMKEEVYNKQNYNDYNNQYSNNQYSNKQNTNVQQVRVYNQNVKSVPLTEANLMKVSGESMISYDIPKYDSIETKSIKSKKSHISERSEKSNKSHKSSVSSIDFSVGDDNKNRYKEVDDFDDRRSQISSLSAGSIKSQFQKQNYHKNVELRPVIKKRDYDEESIVSKISKKSYISVSSVSSLDSNISKNSFQSKKSEKPLIQSSYLKRAEVNPMAFDKFSNQNTQEADVKVDVKRIKNIDEFKAKINHYIKLDDEIKTLSDALRERRKEKQRFEGELLNFMKDNDISSIKNKQDNSQIELIQKKKTETLNKEYIVNCLIDLLKNKSTAENITNYMYSKRGVVETEKIKRVVENKKINKKNK